MVDQSAQQKALAERQKAVTHYHQATARSLADAIEQCAALETMLTRVRHCKDPDEMLFLASLAAHELPKDIHHFVLSTIARRIWRLRRHAGLVEIDDPLPGEPDSVFLLCREVLT